MLRRSPQAPKVYMLGDFVIPSSKQSRHVFFKMRDILNSVLAQISAGMAYIFINQKAYQKEDFKKGSISL